MLKENWRKSKLEISHMTLDDLLQIKDELSINFDPFWSFEIFKSELENPNSLYFVIKQDSEIIAFAGIWKAPDEIHLMNIVTRIDKRNSGFAPRMRVFFP